MARSRAQARGRQDHLASKVTIQRCNPPVRPQPAEDTRLIIQLGIAGTAGTKHNVALSMCAGLIECAQATVAHRHGPLLCAPGTPGLVLYPTSLDGRSREAPVLPDSIRLSSCIAQLLVPSTRRPSHAHHITAQRSAGQRRTAQHSTAATCRSPSHRTWDQRTPPTSRHGFSAIVTNG